MKSKTLDWGDLMKTEVFLDVESATMMGFCFVFLVFFFMAVFAFNSEQVSSLN